MTQRNNRSTGTRMALSCILFCMAVFGNTLLHAQTPNFGSNVYIISPSTPQATINSILSSVSGESQFSANRYAVLFQPGAYNVQAPVGYYESIAGLGRTPSAVTINGYLTPDYGPAATLSPSSDVTQNFWRSMENITINVATNTPQNGAANTLQWGVSQAAPLRRMQINGALWLADSYCGLASGGFISDTVITGNLNACSQQQYYTRNSSIGSFSGTVWNYVFSGVNGAPPQSFSSPAGNPNAPDTTLPTTPVSREKPFLYVDSSGNYNVFVPTVLTNSSGVSWASGSMGTGYSLPISRFFIAQPSNTAAQINAALASGQNLILTPGVYQLSAAINITNPDTIVLGMGYATLVPQNGTASMTVADVDGVQIAGLIFDAGPNTSNVLLQVGNPNATRVSHQSNPTSLNDVYFRIGGATIGSANTSLEVDSDNVILDDIWAWRADHAASASGTGWNVNPGNHGLVVNGDNVTALGLAVEHYEQNQVVWNGNGGETIFYQSELPYDVPNQAAWKNGSANGYASYDVSNSVSTHVAYGVGVYSYFDLGQNIVEDTAISVPITTGVAIHDALTVFLNGSGSITNIVNTAGTAANLATKAVPQDLLDYGGNACSVNCGGAGGSSGSGSSSGALNVVFPAASGNTAVVMGSSPALATFGGKVYVAFRSNDTRNILFVTSSTNGVNFPAATGYPSIQMGSAPALAVFNNKLYVAFQANDAAHELCIASSSDGINFSAVAVYAGITIDSAPSLAAFNGYLYVAFQANDGGHALWIASSSDGVNFTASLDSQDTVGGTPALAVFNNSLYIAFSSNDSRNVLYVTSSASGSNFPAATAYPNITMGSAPALVTSNGALYIFFQANDSTHLLFATASITGSNFPAGTASPSVAIGGAPAATTFGSGITVAFRANDPSNILFITNNTGFPGTGSSGTSGSTGGSPTYTVDPDFITTDLNNNTNGAWQDGQIYITILGNNPATGALSWVSSNGTVTSAQLADNTASNAFTGPGGKTYPNYAFTLAQSKELILPPLSAGRIYVSLGSPMYMSIVSTPNGPGYAGPNAQNPTDPNNNTHYDWYEFTYSNSGGIFINTTQVNQFGLPLLLDVWGAGGTFHKQTGITESIAQIDQEFAAQTPAVFHVTPITSYRIFAPSNSANFAAGAANGNYFDSYVSSVWSYYAATPLTVQIGAREFTGKTQSTQFVFTEVNLNNGAYVGGNYALTQPSTQDILGCQGNLASGNSTQLALEAQFCAAFNRNVIESYANWTVPSAYYQQAPANYYAQFWHNHSVGGLAYGFAYDDVNNQSSVIQDATPEHMAFGIGW